MSFRVHREGELEYLTSDVLDGAAHCFSTRFGGVSEGALASLNLGTHRGDRPEKRAGELCPSRQGRWLCAGGDRVFTKQVHSHDRLHALRERMSAHWQTALSMQTTAYRISVSYSDRSCLITGISAGL